MDSNNGEKSTEELLALSKASRKRTREHNAAKKRAQSKKDCRTYFNKKKNKKNKTSKNKWNDVHQAAGYNATGDSQDVVMDEATHQDSANDTQNDVHQATANNAANRESQDVGMVEATHQDSANNETPIHCHFFPTNAGAINGADPANDEAPIFCQVIPPSASANDGANNGANSGSTDDTHGEEGAEDDIRWS